MSRKRFELVYSADGRNKSLNALDKAFKQHAASLRAFLRARLVLEEDREDVVQEVFLKLWRQKGLNEKLSSRTGNTFSYLISIATNLVIDRKRRANVRCADQHDSYEESMVLAEQPSVESVAASRQQLDAMAEVMKKMKPKWREALMLNRFESMSYPEVAKAMGVSITSVERYIASALKLLREEMK